jgi:ATP-binding cassette, subfamily B, bacterial
METEFDNTKSANPFFSKEVWKYFIKLYDNNYRKLLATSFGSAAQILLILPQVLLVRYAFDEVIAQKNIRLLIIIGIVIFVLRLLNSLVALWLRNINIKIINTAIFRLREDLLLKLYNFSRSFHTRHDRKIIHARIVQDSERFCNLSNALVSRIFPAIFISFALSVVLIFLDWYLFLIIMLLIPLLFFTNRYIGKLIKKRVFVFQRSFEKFSKGILFVLRFMDLTVIQSAQKEEINRQKTILSDLQLKTSSMSMIYAVNVQAQEVLTGLIGIVIIIVGGATVALKMMTLGDFLSFYLTCIFLSKYINTITTSIPDVIAGNESMIILYELANTQEFVPYTGTKKVVFEDSITFESVSFRYEEKPVLENINLTIKPGAKIAITGTNGSGKTTLITLILGLYAPNNGKLYVDGVPYDELDISCLSQFFGVVMQHPQLFSGTIRENIMYGAKDSDEHRMLKASKLALADEFIQNLPNAYETQIGEDGVLLSGGECQRLAIARALIREPKLLVLDEPTNHLDHLIVKKIMDNIENIENKPAILLVSHDIDIATFADTIFRLEKGVLEQFRK